MKRTEKEIKREYEKWLSATGASDNASKTSFSDESKILYEELQHMESESIEDAFFRDLEFGTGGLRGVIGAGTNRINVYTVAKATQGLANYIKTNFPDNPSAAIAFDSRNKSDLFSRTAASVLAANMIKVYIYRELMPTPCLSFAVSKLGCSAGIVITASHNPAKYNGYKVYGPDGCQITTEVAAAIFEYIDKTDIFADVHNTDFEEALASGIIEYIAPAIYDEFTEKVKEQSVLFGDEIDRDVAIVYTPLNGTGLKPVTRALQEAGFTNITIVREQKDPDGNFPTCPYPNPEIRDAMKLGLKYCENTGADLLLATDPDADRCGIAVKDKGDYRLITGNEVGLLLLDYICSQRTKHNKMPRNPVFVKTIVTIDLAEKIADHYGVETKNVLTGFKFIGEVIGQLESEGRESDYICGFEESYGYLTGTYARDKDAVNAAFMICEMYAYYKKKGTSLTDKLNEIYSTYGYCENTLHSYQFVGLSGMTKMQNVMKRFRSGLDRIGGLEVKSVLDYKEGLNNLPKADVLKFVLEGNSSVVIRPSGTEPKLKAYLSLKAEDHEKALAAEETMIKQLETIINGAG